MDRHATSSDPLAWLSALPEYEQRQIDDAIRERKWDHKWLLLVESAMTWLPIACPAALVVVGFIWARTVVGYGILGAGGVILGLVASRILMNTVWPGAYSQAAKIIAARRRGAL
jgi:hypothetical protein